jgi:hypothetical protein
MSAVLSIAAREVRERRFLLVAALLVGMLPVVTTLWPSLVPAADGELVTLFLGLAFPPAVALAVGASVIGRDLAEGRLGFYFARPISGFTLWSGKVLGGSALVVLTLALVVVPITWLDDGWNHWLQFPLVMGVLYLGLATVTAHVVTSLYRSRGAWLALDVALFAFVTLAFRRLLLGLIAAGGGDSIVETVLPCALVGAAGAGLLASAVQVIVGRADAKRGGSLLARTYWLGMLGLLSAFVAWSSWVLGTTPEETGGARYAVALAPRGGGLFLPAAHAGRAGFRPLFVMDAANGSWQPAPERAYSPVFTSDGRGAFWIASPADIALDRRASVVVARFGAGRPRIESTPADGIDVPPGDVVPGALDVDAEGRRLLVAAKGFVAVVDTVSGATTARLAIADASDAQLLADGLVRVLSLGTASGAPDAVLVTDWNPRTGARAERARFAVTGQPVLLGLRGDEALISSDGRELLLVDVARKTRLTIARSEGRSRAPLWSSRATGLAGGGTAVGTEGGVWVVPKDAPARRLLELAAPDRAWSLVQPTPQELAIGILGHATRTVFVDLASGAVTRTESGLVPVVDSVRRWRTPVEPGSLCSRLYVSDADDLVELTPDGRRRVIVAGQR